MGYWYIVTHTPYPGNYPFARLKRHLSSIWDMLITPTLGGVKIEFVKLGLRRNASVVLHHPPESGALRIMTSLYLYRNGAPWRGSVHNGAAFVHQCSRVTHQAIWGAIGDYAATPIPPTSTKCCRRIALGLTVSVCRACYLRRMMRHKAQGDCNDTRHVSHCYLF